MNKKVWFLFAAELVVVLGILTALLAGARLEQIMLPLLLLLCVALAIAGGRGGAA